MERDMRFIEEVNQGDKKQMGVQEPPPPPQVHDSLPNSAAKSSTTTATAEKGAASSSAAAAAAAVAPPPPPPAPVPAGPMTVFRECLKNHAIILGAYTVDGCGDFLPGGPEGTIEATLCAACKCHRNFHRKEVDSVNMGAYVPQLWNQPPPPAPFFHHHAPPPPPSHAAAATGGGYLLHHHIAPPPVTHQHTPLALQVASGGGEENMSTPSSNSGGRGGGMLKKRYRTKFTKEQNEMMLGFAEKVGWKIKKQDDDAVKQFCEEALVKKHVLKVWMHNNKNTLGKKRSSATVASAATANN